MNARSKTATKAAKKGARPAASAESIPRRPTEHDIAARVRASLGCSESQPIDEVCGELELMVTIANAAIEAHMRVHDGRAPTSVFDWLATIEPNGAKPAHLRDDVQKPWPSQELRARTLRQLALIWLRDPERVTVHSVRGDVRVQVDEGPHAVFTRDEWETAMFEQMRAGRSGTNVIAESTPARVLKDAVPLVRDAEEVADLLGSNMLVSWGAVGEGPLLVEHERDHCLYRVEPVDPVAGTVRVSLVGRMACGLPVPRLETFVEDDDETVPAYDDLAKGAA
ncbi:MAG: hypothetical protein HYV09_35840 [Deltaproteobacteria bacterium]|nr:hypothetical protein [Deltaproteobacteria bacterium]